MNEMINSTLEFLYGLHSRGIKLGLKNIESFLEACGNPHQKIQTIHLAGTNGKGSTSSIISKILQENGYKVGLYTSPHLIRFNERIRINGKPISDIVIIEFIQKHKQTLLDSSITFSESLFFPILIPTIPLLKLDKFNFLSFSRAFSVPLLLNPK